MYNENYRSAGNEVENTVCAVIQGVPVVLGAGEDSIRVIDVLDRDEAEEDVFRRMLCA